MKRILFLLLSTWSLTLEAQQKDSTVAKSTDLPEVIIPGVDQSADVSSEFSSRMPLKAIENPQLTHSVHSRLILNRNYFLQFNLLSNVTGVSPSWAGVSPYYTIRGFRTRSNFRNGILGYVASDTDPVNLAQLDVIKGPSGTLFGSAMTVFGGLINRITVKPQPQAFGSVSLAGGTMNFQRATLDVNTPLTERSLMRITGAYTSKGSFQNQGLYRNLFLAPSFSYRMSKRLNLELEAEILRRVSTNNTLITPANPLKNGILTNAVNPDQLRLNYYTSYTDNSVLFQTTAVNFYAKANYEISTNWKSETHLISSNSQSAGDYQTMTLIKDNTALVRRIVNYAPESITYQQLQQNFMGNVRTGRFRHRLLVGLDYYHYVYATTANGIDGSRANAGEGNLRPAFDTLTLGTSSPAAGLLNQREISQRLIGKVPTFTRSTLNTYSVYASDVISPIKPLTILLSARVDVMDNRGTYNPSLQTTTGAYLQTAFSPKVGLTYQLIADQLALFASYMNGFQNVAPVSQVNGQVSNFRPQAGNQTEAGVKYRSTTQRWEASVSYYNIAVSRTIRSNPENVTLFIQDGKQFSKGVELDLHMRPFTGFYLHAGLAYNNSKLMVSDASTLGLRPVNSGPDWMGNFYANYLLSQGVFKGLSWGLGGNYYGKDYIINSKSAGSFYTKAYYLFNAVMSYSQPSFSLSLSGDNVLNHKYYYGGRGFITPGNLRQVILSLKVNF